MEMIGILLIVGVGMYFLMIRPAQKQQKKQKEMMAALEPGVRVMLGSGIYGTIRHLGEKQAIIEISPGVDLTILRAAIRGAVTADEEEFEYATDGLEEPPAEEAGAIDMGAFEADLARPDSDEPDPDEPDPGEPDPGENSGNEDEK